MLTDLTTNNLPKGWMIIQTMEPAGASFDPVYTAYRWTTRTTKKLFRKPVTRTGWYEAGFRSRWEDKTREWIIGTDEQMKKPVQKSLFDITAKGQEHVSILLNGEIYSFTKVYGPNKEAVAYATLRWGEDDSLTYDNAYYVSVTRRKEA